MVDFARLSVSVFGLGYVGCVSAVCLASKGHKVIGVDISEHKMRLLRHGQSPIVEEKMAELTAEVVGAGTLTVSADIREAIDNTQISLICVGTPSDKAGGLSTEYLEQVTNEIGTALASKHERHTVVYRSTMLPGTCEGLLIPILEGSSGKRVGRGLGVGINPEYLREGSSVRDFFDPPKTVVGGSDDEVAESVLGLYRDLPGEVFTVPIRVAEMTKYVDNSFHALKVGFANEIGAICSALEIDSHAVMEPFIADTKLNIGPAYLKPGFAFGGSCLPKDLRALRHVAQLNAVETPILSNVLRSNEMHLGRGLELIAAEGRRRISLFGLSFKSGTDDLRESPLVELAERLIGKGFDLKIFDPNVAISRVVGANRAYVNEKLPHLSDLLVENTQAAIDHGEIIVVGAVSAEVLSAVEASPEDRLIVDLVRLPDSLRLRAGKNYRAIAW